MHHPWFRAKTYGWGWTPATWQGWLVVLIYAGTIGGSALLFLRPRPTVTGCIEYVSTIAVASALLVAICIRKGEKLGWRWGDRKD
jgi:hypothetical protein